MRLGRRLRGKKLEEAGRSWLRGAVGGYRCPLPHRLLLSLCYVLQVAWAVLRACFGLIRYCTADQIAQVVQVGRAQSWVQLGEAGFVELAGWLCRTTTAVYAKWH